LKGGHEKGDDMDEDLMNNEIDILAQLREDLDMGEETAVVAPKMPLIQRLKIKYSGFKRYRIMIVRGLVVFMALLIVGQLVYSGIMTMNQYDGGPVPLSVAVEQVEDDLVQVPEPPLIR
jgi:hypothetical protein